MALRRKGNCPLILFFICFFFFFITISSHNMWNFICWNTLMLCSRKSSYGLSSIQNMKNKFYRGIFLISLFYQLCVGFFSFTLICYWYEGRGFIVVLKSFVRKSETPFWEVFVFVLYSLVAFLFSYTSPCTYSEYLFDLYLMLFAFFIFFFINNSLWLMTNIGKT